MRIGCVHDRYGVVECLLERIEVDDASCVDADNAAVKGLDGVQDRVMLDRRADRDAAATTDRTEYGHVVGFGTAAREDQVGRPRAQRFGDDVAGVVDGATGSTRHQMRAQRIAIVDREERQHRGDGFGPHRRRRRVIEVRTHAPQTIEAQGCPSRSPTRRARGCRAGADTRPRRTR